MRLDIDPDDLRLLMNRTEGWPAAIYLASLSLQKRDDTHAFIESFRGSSRYIVDLLGEEVLAGLPGDVRDFLLMTSVLRSMTGPLCDEVASREGSGKLLRELARSNLFVVPLDEPGEWYRYHNLFSDLLRYELKSSRPEVVPVLHGRASSWCEREGYLESAVRYAIAAADHELAGLTATVERWLDALPEDFINADAALILVKAWISALYGRREERDRYMALAESRSSEEKLPDGTASVESGIATIRSIFAYEDVQSIAYAGQHAAALDPERTSPWAAHVRLGLGHGLYLSGETSRARKSLEEALALTKPVQPLVRMAVLFSLSNVALDEGHLGEAESHVSEARALVNRFRLHKIPQATLAPIAAGRVLAERGELYEAQEVLESALSA